ncbi:MAG: NAD-dependent epimerase/dehydratase family protein [Bacteroidota bacterium]|nr:NAD-dependent epimerase/dehydratase family protein [Bacteroidota bacterium]MDP4231131.1 NAD-dependent epimerase/dehydratase family protein [Bacteroidota bacterium]MDP4235560.1 NAD-dependent epimerase/dehydratase family protein [Bacteroidota bacterium]
MPTSLVTGAAGFIGSHVVDALLKNGHRVVALDDLSGGFVDNVNPKAIFIEAGCTDHVKLARIFNEYSFDYVFHLAAYAAEGLSHFIKRFNYTNNVIGSVNLINESVKHDVKRFIFTSSIAVYGRNQLPMKEELVPQPEDSYGIAKYAVELELKASHEMFGLDYVIFRPHNVYGERQNTGDKYRNVIGIFMNQLLAGESLTLFGDGQQKRAFSYIADVAPIIAQSATLDAAKNEIFNVGADTVYTVNQLAEAVMDAMGSRSSLKYLPARNEVVNAWSDHEKVHRTFGTPQEVSLSEGLKKMADWVKSTGPRKSKPFEGIEIEKNLPPSWREQTKN